ncbi:MAG: thiamine ABC transporter substrate-binding protein [Chloroflexi bacterium]|nr:thiamine ABC transporter substrate-binding protein [Chloroflexota bacterium]
MPRPLTALTALLLAAVLLAACAAPTPPPAVELVLMTHDSFDISKEVIAQFEKANNAKVTILKAGDAGEALTLAILSKDNPPADLFFGVDNTFLGRALAEQVFTPYRSPLLEKVPEKFRLDPTNHVMPVDYGYVTVNYDRKWLSDRGLAPPATLEDLTKSEWKGRLAVQNPATSSPGLVFLLATIVQFGETGDYTYLDFWRDLKADGVLVKDGWSTTYYTDFTLYGGDRPLVVSYTTSPPAEVFFSEGKYTEPPTGNILGKQASFLQIEGVGILKGTKREALAKKLVDFMMDTTFQKDIPSHMFVFPTNQDAPLPDFFRFAESPESPATIHPVTIAENRERWIDAWTNAMLK